MSDRQVNYVHYEEVIPPAVFQYFLYALIGLFGYLVVTKTGDMPPMLGIFGLMIIYGASSIFGRLTIIITESVLSVGFSFLKYRIELDNIDYVEVRSMPWWKYGGFGIRFGFDWSVGYIVNYSKGVRVVPKRGRVLFFSSNRPEEIEEIIGKMILAL